MNNFSERLDKIRTRASQSESDSNEYWNVTLCQEDRRFLLDYVDRLLCLEEDRRDIMSQKLGKVVHAPNGQKIHN